MKIIKSTQNNYYSGIREEDLEYTLVMCLHSSEKFEEILTLIPKIKKIDLEYDELKIGLKKELKVTLHKVSVENEDLVNSIEDLLVHTLGVVDSDYDEEANIFYKKLIYDPDGQVCVSYCTDEIEEICMVDFIFDITKPLEELCLFLF